MSRALAFVAGALVVLASARPPEEYAFTGFATVWITSLRFSGQRYVHALIE